MTSTRDPLKAAAANCMGTAKRIHRLPMSIEACGSSVFPSPCVGCYVSRHLHARVSRQSFHPLLNTFVRCGSCVTPPQQAGLFRGQVIAVFLLRRPGWRCTGGCCGRRLRSSACGDASWRFSLRRVPGTGTTSCGRSPPITAPPARRSAPKATQCKCKPPNASLQQLLMCPGLLRPLCRKFSVASWAVLLLLCYCSLISCCGRWCAWDGISSTAGWWDAGLCESRHYLSFFSKQLCHDVNSLTGGQVWRRPHARGGRERRGCGAAVRRRSCWRRRRPRPC